MLFILKLSKCTSYVIILVRPSCIEKCGFLDESLDGQCFGFEGPFPFFHNFALSSPRTIEGDTIPAALPVCSGDRCKGGQLRESPDYSVHLLFRKESFAYLLCFTFIVFLLSEKRTLKLQILLGIYVYIYLYVYVRFNLFKDDVNYRLWYFTSPIPFICVLSLDSLSFLEGP